MGEFKPLANEKHKTIQANIWNNQNKKIQTTDNITPELRQALRSSGPVVWYYQI